MEGFSDGLLADAASSYLHARHEHWRLGAAGTGSGLRDDVVPLGWHTRPYAN